MADVLAFYCFSGGLSLQDYVNAVCDAYDAFRVAAFGFGQRSLEACDGANFIDVDATLCYCLATTDGVRDHLVTFEVFEGGVFRDRVADSFGKRSDGAIVASHRLVNASYYSTYSDCFYGGD